MLTPRALGTTTVADTGWNPWFAVPVTTTKVLYVGELDDSPWTFGCKIVKADGTVGTFVELPAGEYSEGIALSSYRLLLVGDDIPGVQAAGAGKMRYNLAYLDVSADVPIVLWFATTDWIETPTTGVVNYNHDGSIGYRVAFTGASDKVTSPNFWPIGDDGNDDSQSANDGPHWMYTLNLTSVLRPSWNASTPSLNWAEYICNQNITFDDFGTSFLVNGSSTVLTEASGGAPKASQGWLTYSYDNNIVHCRMADSDTWEFRLVTPGPSEVLVDGATDYAPTALIYYMATNPVDNMPLNWENWCRTTGIKAHQSASFGWASTTISSSLIVGNPSEWVFTDGEDVETFLTVSDTSASTVYAAVHPNAGIPGFVTATTLVPDTTVRFDFYEVETTGAEILNEDGSIGGDRTAQPPVEVGNGETHNGTLYDTFYNACQVSNNKILVWYREDSSESSMHTKLRLIGRGGWKGPGLDYEVTNFDGGDVTVGATTAIHALSNTRVLAVTWGDGTTTPGSFSGTGSFAAMLRATYLDVSGNNPVILWEDEWNMPSDFDMDGLRATYSLSTATVESAEGLMAFFSYSQTSNTDTKKKTYCHVWKADIQVTDGGGSIDTYHKALYAGTDTNVAGKSQGYNYCSIIPRPGVTPYVYFYNKGDVYSLVAEWGSRPRLEQETHDMLIERLKETGWSRKHLWLGQNYMLHNGATIYAKLPGYDEGSDYQNLGISNGEGMVIIDTGQYGWSVDVPFDNDQEAYQGETYFSQPRTTPKRLHLAWIQVWPEGAGSDQPPILALFDATVANAKVWDGASWVTGPQVWDGTSWRPMMIYDGENWV